MAVVVGTNRITQAGYCHSCTEPLSAACRKQDKLSSFRCCQAHRRSSVRTCLTFACKHVDVGQCLQPACMGESTTHATRRGFGGTIMLSGALLVWAANEAECAGLPEKVVADGTMSRDGPVVVFGAGGRVGRRCVAELARRGRTVIAFSRSGKFDLVELGLSLTSDEARYISVVKGDLRNPDDLARVLGGASGAIFAATASKKGGTPAEVDKKGAVGVAMACIACHVPRLVLVSAGGVSKPSSPIFKYNNIYGGLMQAKFEGEEGVRQLYKTLDPTVGLSYTILRPGGITDEPPLGIDYLELSQGDVFSGRVSYADVAEVCVESLLSSFTGGSTFELYYQPRRGVSAPPFLVQPDTKISWGSSGQDALKYMPQIRGYTYSDLFEKLKVDY